MPSQFDRDLIAMGRVVQRSEQIVENVLPGGSTRDKAAALGAMVTVLGAVYINDRTTYDIDTPPSPPTPPPLNAI